MPSANTERQIHPPYSRRGKRAVGARLDREDWTEMARPAFSSPNNRLQLDYWRRIVRESNPHLNEEQVDRRAKTKLSEYQSDIARKRWAPKDAARRTDCGCGSAGHGPDECPESAPERAA